MIEVRDLCKLYGSKVAIDNVGFSVAAGEIMGFLGPNGAGKTTTMRILSGFIPATTGTATIASYDVHQDLMAVRRCIGYLPENPPLYPDMTVEGFLYFVANIKGVKASDRKKRVRWSLERCQLEDKARVIIRKLSKGYRQRVGIAQAIVHDPPVIILDEPTVGLDPRQIIEVRNLIRSLAGEHTIILSTHILPEVSMTCDRVTIINQGRIVATNTPDNLMQQFAGICGYEIEVEGDVDLVLPLLRGIPGVSSVEVKVIPETVTDRLLLSIGLDQQIEAGREIAAVLVNGGLGLYEMRRIQPSLEDVFLQFTRV